MSARGARRSMVLRGPGILCTSARMSRSLSALSPPSDRTASEALSIQRTGRRVLSIQSHVVSGYAGNKCAVFPLQINGFEVDFINSVQFSNHTGYKHLRGQRLNCDQLSELYEGLSLNKITKYSHILTGYCGDVTFLSKIGDIVRDLKEKNKDLVYVCDPVLGDDGVYYTPKELLPKYRDEVIRLADVVTPNAFELGELTGLPVTSEVECLAAMKVLHGWGIPRIVVTSGIPQSSSDSLVTIASTHFPGQAEPLRFRFEYKRVAGNYVGTGDTFASLLLVNLEDCEGDLNKAVGRVLGSLHNIIETTRSLNAESTEPLMSKAPELRFIESRKNLLFPPFVVEGTPL